MTETKIFITGATGYIGGAVLARLLEHPNAKSFHITALVRSPTKLEKLKAIGVNTIHGSYQDLDVLTSAASEADLVIACVNADDEPAAQAILAGMKKRHESTGKVPILIHTSGTGVLMDHADGMHTYDTIYDDSDPEQIATLAPSQIHRPVDLMIDSADKAGYARTHIILPSTIWGIATSRLVDLGIQNPRSQQIPVLITASLDRGQGGMIGLGLNLWPNVQIEDVADLYIILYDHIVSSPSTTGHGTSGYYFGENGEHKLYDVCAKISEVLVTLKKGKSPIPTTFTDEEAQKYFGGKYLGSNSRCKGVRSRALGWKPKMGSTAEMLASIDKEVAAALEK